MRSQKRGKKKFRFTDRKSRAKRENARLKKKVNKATTNPILGDQWDMDKTVKQNLDTLGLAYNPNDVIGQTKALKVEDAVEEMEVAAPPETTTKTSKSKKKRARAAAKKAAPPTVQSLVSTLESAALEKEAKQRSKSVVKLQKDDVKFCSAMIAKHGLDFEAISRDPANIWQHTAAQIKRKLEVFKKSPAFKNSEPMGT